MSAQLSTTTKQALSLGDTKLQNFHTAHPDFDLLHFDFYDTSPRTQAFLATIDPSVRSGLHAQQRLVRITGDGEQGRRLQAAGFNSAHAIAVLPEHRFVRQYAAIFNNKEEARAVHQRAGAIKAACKHLYANIHSMQGSPHFNAMLANQVDDSIGEYFQQIPTYQDLFGSLNYCKCKACASIFSPSAYFLDLMRVTDDYITDPNITKPSGNIPPGYQLNERRPDLFDLPLTCANTNTPIPTIEIVNQVLARRIGQAQSQTSGTAQSATLSSINLDSNASSANGAYTGMWIAVTGGTGVNQLREIASYEGSGKVANITQAWTIQPDNSSHYTISVNPYQTLAAAPYPFNLPANLPLAEIRCYLAALRTTLPEIYAALLPPVNQGYALAATKDTLTLAASASATDNAYLTMTLSLVAGTGANQSRQIIAYNGSTRLATVDHAWHAQPDVTTQYTIVDSLPIDREIDKLTIEQYGIVTTPLSTSARIAPFYGYQTIDLAQIAHVELFLQRTGLTWEQLQFLLTQGLSSAEQKAGVADTFFINATGEDIPAMTITIDNTNVDAPFYKITNLSLLRLDRLNRFIRLSTALAWDYSSLDWAMKSIAATEISEAAIKAFAGISQLHSATGLDVVTLCAFWADMKTCGKGNGPNPDDLFDKIFNNPALLKGQNPYTSVVAIPFDPARPLTWTVDDRNDQNGEIRARLVGALNCSDDDLTKTAAFVMALTASQSGTLVLTLSQLSWLFRLTKAAAIFGLPVDAYLLLLGLMYFPGNDLTLPAPGALHPTVATVQEQKRMVDWFNASPFTVYSALYILDGIVLPYFTPAYRPDDIAPFVQNLSTVSAGSRLTPQAFVFGIIEAAYADKLYTKLVETQFFSNIGVLLSQAPAYQQVAWQFPLTAQSFVTSDITLAEATLVYSELENHQPPLIQPFTKPDQSTVISVAQRVTNKTDLSFLFAGQTNAPNKRNQVLSVLLETQRDIYFTEFSFAFVLPGEQFVSPLISPEESAHSLRLLAEQQPPLVILDPALGQSRTIGQYDGATRTATVDSAWTTNALPGPSSVYVVSQTVSSGTAQGGTINTLILADSASNENASYIGMKVSLTGGAGAGQVAIISVYDGGTRVATVAPAWVSLPDNTTVYLLATQITQGIAVSGTTTTISLDETASSATGAYQGFTVEIALSGLLTTQFSAETKLDFLFTSKGADQSGTIVGYDGQSRTATLDTPWQTIPDDTTYYQVILPVLQGTALGGTRTTIILAGDASATDGAYNGMTIRLTDGTGAGQVALIYDYVGSTRTATLQASWSTVPGVATGYSIVQIVTQGAARAGSATTLALDANASAMTDAYKDMLLALVSDPEADIKRGQVKQNLLDATQAIDHTAQVIVSYEAMQQGNAMQGLADLLGTTAERLAEQIPVATQATDLDDYLDDLLTPINDGQVPASLPPFIAALARAVVLFDAVGFTTDEIRAVTAIPHAFGITDPHQLTLTDLTSFTLFKGLVRQFDNKSDRLIDYLRRPPDISCPGSTTLALSALSHWPALQICTLDSLFWPDGIAAAPRGPGTVHGLSRLNACFLISDATGLDIPTLLQIDAMGTLPVAGPSGIIPINWQVYNAMSGLVLAAVNAKFGDGDFASVNNDMCKLLNQQRRDALLGYTIWLLQQTYPEIDSPNALYQYLLIDVEMGGCDTTSYIAQGIAALQLYMQRCRLMLEPGVTDLSNIPEVWWEWLSGYRIWEANRKIFLYPENYLEPALRKGATPQFNDLTDALMQTDVSEKSVTNAYQAYFQGVNTVSGLVNASAYSCRLPQLGTSIVYNQGNAQTGTANTITLASGASIYFGAYTGMRITITGGTGANQVNSIVSYDGGGVATVAVPWATIPDSASSYVITGEKQTDTLFLVARTNTAPAVYYTRQYDPVNSWTPWLQAKISIASPYVTPVYAFNKLYLFWAEQKVVDGSKITSTSGGSSSVTITDVTASLKLSYQDNSGEWLPPQTLADNIVITYKEAYILDEYVRKVIEPLYYPCFDPKLIYWQKPYPLHLPDVKFTQTTKYPSGEHIFVNYGFGHFFQMGSGTLPPPSLPSEAIPADQHQIEWNAYSMVGRFNMMSTSPTPQITGYLPFQQTLTLGGDMTLSKLNTALINYPKAFASLYPQPYVPALIRTSGQFGVANSTTWNIIIDNYQSDDYPNAPLGATSCDLLLLSNVSGKTASSVTVKNNPGSYLFDNGDEAFLVRTSDSGVLPISEVVLAQASYTPFPADEFYLQTQSYTTTRPAPTVPQLRFTFNRITTTVVHSLTRRLLQGGIPNLLTVQAQLTPEPPFNRLTPNSSAVIPPPTDRLDFNGAYGLYFWEIFFHAPFLVADSLRNNQRFSEAKDWYEYIFNPTQQPEGKSDDAQRYWRFLPFRTMDIPTLTQILTNPAQIAAYNNDPFDPDAIARLRTVAYAKAIMMKYISNLLAWGDYLFAQDTRESINQATNLYVLASDLLGPRPIEVGECAASQPMSFNDVKEEYNNRTITTGTAISATANTLTLAGTASTVADAYAGYYLSITAGAGNGQTAYITAYAAATHTATVEVPWVTLPNATSQYRVFANGIPEFLIRLENTPMVLAPDITGVVPDQVAYSDVPFNDINSYFCVPENSELIAYWDLVDDRLFKIRHCMNLAGQVRSLTLFAPPLNPRDLIQAARASGGSEQVSSQLNMPIPYYRFSALLERAKGLTAAVTQLGGQLLATLEKRDAEALALLRNSQEHTLLQLTTLIKEQQIEEAKQAGLALNQSLLSAQKRQSWYAEQIAKGLSSNEIQNIVYMTLATLFNTSAAAVRTMASIGYAVPQVGSPFAMTYGGQQIGAALTAASGVLEGLGIIANFGAQLNLTMAQYRRRESEWQLQSDLAGYDVAQIQYQIAGNTAQQKIAARDLEIQLTSLAQNEALDAFLKNKFTNQELYQWMATRLSVLYFQTYQLALELSRSAQRAYQYEMNTDTTFVNFGYWDSGLRGLLAGEGVMLALNQMEKSYLDRNARTLEIDKTVSLLRLNPRALLDLIETGECMFELPEKLFCDDFPGHYSRKIKTISVSIPAIIGPYQNLHATLTQLSNQVVIKPNVNTINYLLGASDASLPDSSALRSSWWSNQSIVLSRGLSDNGLFEPSAGDERYLPFEGTGAVSTWRLSMPKTTNHFDFRSITDVLFQLSYTAVDGGEKLRQDVVRLSAMRSYSGSNFFSCAQCFSTSWYQFLELPTSVTQQTLSFTLADLVPDHIGKAVLTGFYFQLVTPPTIDPSSSTPYIQLSLGKVKPVTFSVDRQGKCTYFFQAVPKMADAEGASTISFNLANTPAALKEKTDPQRLDPAVVQNIVLILFYDGEIRWS